MGLGWLMAPSRTDSFSLPGQFEAWRQLAAQGLYLATNPNSFVSTTSLPRCTDACACRIVALALVVGRICRSRAAFRKSTFRSDRDVIGIHGQFVALSAACLRHEIVGVSKWEGL